MTTWGKIFHDRDQSYKSANESWVTGTEEGTWWDEHWELFYMLANWTLIKNKFIERKQKKQSSCGLGYINEMKNKQE